MSRLRNSTEDSLAELSQHLATALAPMELGAEQRDALRRRVLERAREKPPEGTVTVRAGVWTEVRPGIEVRPLRIDRLSGTHTTLMRMRPGGVVPAHRHEQDEEFIVIEGSCRIGTHQLSAGDAHFARAGSWHEATTTETGVLVLMRGEYPYPNPRAGAPG